MAPRNFADRTVQYWRLVDARDGSEVEELDWHDIITRYIYGQRQTFVIDKRDHAGTAIALTMEERWTPAFDVNGIDGAVALADPSTTYGIVMAAGKDFVPNQANRSNGAQQPMSLAGDLWEPVDNLFVTFLPFGNMIGVLAESTSSSRAAKFADWLTLATRGAMADPEFSWLAEPVIDPTRAQLLQNARGLKSAVFAGEIGRNVDDASGVRAIFGGPAHANDVGRIRIEVKASVVRGKSDHGDEEQILEWFNETFGPLDGTVDKAQVTIAPTDDSGVTEVDLLHHRLTRKTAVRLVTGTSRAFTGASAVAAILDAFTIDRADLLRLRSAN